MAKNVAAKGQRESCSLYQNIKSGFDLSYICTDLQWDMPSTSCYTEHHPNGKNDTPNRGLQDYMDP